MTRYLIADAFSDSVEEIDLNAFLELTMGTGLRSAAAADDFFEFGTSENLNVRFQTDQDGDLVITCFSTLNHDEVAPIQIKISEEGSAVTAQTLQNKLFALRQIYALTYLHDIDKLDLAYGNILAGRFDFEAMLIPSEAQLIISSINSGSPMWVTLIAKSIQMRGRIMRAFSLFYKQGRDALLDRTQARTDMQVLEVEAKATQNKIESAKGLIGLAKDIEGLQDPDMKAALKQNFFGNLKVIDETRETVKVIAAEAKTDFRYLEKPTGN